jgi:hypothetical protein
MGLRLGPACWVHTALDLVHFRVALRAVLDEAAQVDATIVALYPDDLSEIFAGLAQAAGCRKCFAVEDTLAGTSTLPVAPGQSWWWLGELSRTRPWLSRLHALPHPPDVIFCSTLWRPNDPSPLPLAVAEGFSPYITGTPVRVVPMRNGRAGGPARRR